MIETLKLVAEFLAWLSLDIFIAGVAALLALGIAGAIRFFIGGEGR